MSVPQKRNEKKTRRRPRQPYINRPRHLILDKYPVSLDEQPTFEEWLDEIVHPGDWLEEYANMPTLEERLLSVRQGGFLDRDDGYDPDDDIGSDFDDLYEE